MNKKVDKSDTEKIIRAKWTRKINNMLAWYEWLIDIMSSIELNAKIKTKNNMNELNH